eukprot:SAG22_NODE_6122_length_895_cov_4.087940_1_plen_98_part_10
MLDQLVEVAEVSHKSKKKARKEEAKPLKSTLAELEAVVQSDELPIRMGNDIKTKIYEHLDDGRVLIQMTKGEKRRYFCVTIAPDFADFLLLSSSSSDD